MHIWYISAYDQPRGNSTRSYDFSRSLVERGHQVTFFTNSFCHFTRAEKLTNGEVSRLEGVDGIQVVWLKTPEYEGNGLRRGINMLANAWRVVTESKKLELGAPDVVVGPSVPLFTGLAAYQVAKRYDCPFVFEIRDVWPEALVLMGAISRRGLTYRIFRWVEKLLYRKANMIVSTLPFVNKHVEESIGRTKKIEYIPNGVDFDLFGPMCPPSVVDKKTYNVTYIGGFGVGHDIELILRVAKRLHDMGDDKYHFHLIGSGVKKFASTKYVEHHGLKNIFIYDSIPKSNIPEKQCSSDVLIAAITDAESYKFGLNLNKLCGYLASGRPVILAGNPPNDPVSDSGAWFKVPAGDVDGVIRALGQIRHMTSSERLDHGMRGRMYAHEILNMEVLGSKMEVLLKSLVERKLREKF